MSARAAVTQRPQYGVETAIGTSVAADKAFRSLSLTVEPKVETETIKPAGRRFGTGTYVKSESSEGSLEGQVCARELTDVLGLVFGDATATSEPYAGVTGRTFVLSDDAQSWTVQAGDATNAVEVAGVIATGVDFEFEKNSGKAEIKVKLVGQVYDNEATLTASPVEELSAILTGAGTSVYIADTLAGLDADPTQLPYAISEKIKFEKMRDVAWYTDASKPSWSDVVADDASGSELELVIEASEAGRAFLGYLRDGTSKYIRVVTTGATIASTYKQKLTIDLCVAPSGYKEKEEDAVYAVTVPLTVVEDEDGFSHQVSLQNDVDLLAGLTPTTGSATPTAGGFTFNITNYDGAYTWTATAPGATVTIGTPSGSTALVTVSGLGSSVSKTVTIGTSRTLYKAGSATRSGTSSA